MESPAVTSDDRLDPGAVSTGILRIANPKTHTVFGTRKWNITFLSRFEFRTGQRALLETWQTPRPILIPWARLVDLESEPDSTSNPTKFQEDTPGSTANPKDMVTQSIDQGGNRLAR